MRKACLALLLAASVSPAFAQDKTFDLKISHWVPASHPLQKSLEDWVAAVNKGSAAMHLHPEGSAPRQQPLGIVDARLDPDPADLLAMRAIIEQHRLDEHAGGGGSSTRSVGVLAGNGSDLPSVVVPSGNTVTDQLSVSASRSWLICSATPMRFSRFTIDRAVERCQPAHHRRLADLLLGDECGAALPGDRQDIDPAQMVGDVEDVALQRHADPLDPRAGHTPGPGEEYPRPGRSDAQQPPQIMERHGDQQPEDGARRRAGRSASSQGCRWERVCLPPRRRASDSASGKALGLAVEGDAVQFHAVVDQAEAEPFGDRLLAAARARDRRTRSPCRSRRRSGDRGAIRARARSASGRRRNHGGRGCRPPRTGAPCGRRSRSRCRGRSPMRGRRPSPHRDGPPLRKGRAR